MADQNVASLPVTPVGTADTSSAPASNDVIGQLIQDVGNQRPTAAQNIQATLPVAPKIAPPYQAPMKNEHQGPIANTAIDIKQARTHNNFAMITNALNQYANQKRTEKNLTLQRNIEDVLTAQQQIANAQAALQNNPQDKAAQDVLQKNKLFLEGKFNDKKTAKELQKAFDVSFTNPEQNNTDEVKAGQAAIKAVKEKTQAGLDHNSPQEQSVAQQQQSSTPKADQFLNSRPSQLQQNPEYAKQQGQILAQQKAVYEKVLPAVIQQVTRENVAKLHEDGALQRKLGDWDNSLKIAQEKFLTEAKIADARDKTTLAKQAMADRAAFSRTMLRVDAAKQIATDKRLADSWKGQAAKEKTLEIFDGEIAKLNKANDDIGTQLLLAEKSAAKGDTQAQQQVNNLKHQRDMNNLMVAQYTDNRQKTATEIFGQPIISNPTGNTAPYGAKNGQQSGTDTATKSDGSGSSGPADDSDSDAEDKAIDDGDFQSTISSLINE